MLQEIIPIIPSERNLIGDDLSDIMDLENPLTLSQLNIMAKIDEQDAAYLYFEQKEKEKISPYYD